MIDYWLFNDLRLYTATNGKVIANYEMGGYGSGQF